VLVKIQANPNHIALFCYKNLLLSILKKSTMNLDQWRSHKVVRKEIEFPTIQTISMGDACAIAGLWSYIMRGPTLEQPESTSQLSLGSHCTDYVTLSMAKTLNGIDFLQASSSKFYGHPMFRKCWRHVK
jgi:hypothetical protein